MLKRVPLMLVAALLAFSGCKKSDPPPEPEPMVDTAMVLPEPPELEPIEEAFPDTQPAPEPVQQIDPARGISKNGPYTLQVGIFNNERQAQKMAQKLKNQGFPAYVTRVEDPTPALPGTYFRVRIGAFASTRAARAYGQQNLAPQGIEFWADLKGRDSAPVEQVFKPRTLPAPKPAPAPATPPSPPPVQVPATEPPPEVPAPAEPASDTKPAPQLPDW